MSNQITAQRLFTAIRLGRAAHAVLLCGQEESLANEVALQAAALCCTGSTQPDALSACPDYFSLGPEPYGIESIRELQEKLSAKAFSGWRAVNLFNAHTMTEQAQNALLKTLEEPPASTLLLLSGLGDRLLPTIRSRCATLWLGAQSRLEIQARLAEQGIDQAQASLCAGLSEGALGLAQAFAQPEYLAFRREALDILQQALPGARLAAPPFAQTKALLDMPLGQKTKTASTEAENRKAAAQACLEIWLSFLSDSMHCKLGLGEMVNQDYRLQVEKAAHRFTSKQIQGMIDLLVQAQLRLGRANPGLTLDRLLTDLLDIAN